MDFSTPSTCRTKQQTGQSNGDILDDSFPAPLVIDHDDSADMDNRDDKDDGSGPRRSQKRPAGGMYSPVPDDGDEAHTHINAQDDIPDLGRFHANTFT